MMTAGGEGLLLSLLTLCNPVSLRDDNLWCVFLIPTRMGHTKLI